MLTIFKKMSYLILLNICIVSNHSSASFFSFFEKIASQNNDNNEQVFDNNNKPIELKIQVNSSILKQIKEINNILEDKNDNNKVRDSNFDIIQTQQQRILGILGGYYCDKDVFNRCTVKIKSTISVIDFYNSLFRQRNDFSKLVIELYDILKDQYIKSINELCKSFNKMLNIVNLISIIFNEKNNGGLINNLLLLDNTIGLDENKINNIFNTYIHHLYILIDKDTINYYNDILSEVNVKLRLKNSVLPSQLLFTLFNNIRKELSVKSNELYESYIFFKNKITLTNQKLDSINSYIKDTKQLSASNNENHEEAIVNFINTNIKEQNRINNDVIDEIERIQNVTDNIIEALNDFKNYVPDEKILSIIEQSKINKKESEKQNSKISDNKNIIKENNNHNVTNDKKKVNNKDNKVYDTKDNKLNNNKTNNNETKDTKKDSKKQEKREVENDNTISDSKNKIENIKTDSDNKNSKDNNTDSNNKEDKNNNKENKFS